MPLPIAISVPHAGLSIPGWLQAKCRLSEAEVIQDGDEEAANIYAIENEVATFVSTDIARAVLDMNRPEDDRDKDGIVKTHTCYDIPIWREALTGDEVQRLLAEFHRPYHSQLTQFSQRDDLLLAVDCHTMAFIGPPIAPDTGDRRPWVCLGDVGGDTLPSELMARATMAFQDAFGDDNVAINDPFAGGYITQTHGNEMPWLQLELARGDWMTVEEKRERVLEALSTIANMA